MKKIYIACPNMGNIHIGLAKFVLNQGVRGKYALTWDTPCELRNVDYARNFISKKFLESDCEFLAMVDSDVVPHDNFLDLVELDKPVVAGNTFCFRQGDLMPSIWQRAECEECRNREHFKRTGKILDPSMFKPMEVGEPGDIVENVRLKRWDPLHALWKPVSQRMCRCLGTNRDPWVYRIHERSSQPPRGPFQVDAAGAATLIIRRDVFAKLQWPYFRFLYKESMEQLLAEDLYFCWRAKEAGFEIWADLEIASRHFKQVCLLEMNSVVAKGYQGGVLAGRQSKQDRLIVPGRLAMEN
jgi:hypothetical protein